MNDLVKYSIEGSILIQDANTKEVLREKDNAIHFGNMTFAIAKSLVGNPSFFINYMMFGSGGTSTIGANIAYKSPKVSNVVDSTASVYSPSLLRKVTNEFIPDPDQDPNNFANVPPDQATTNYKDIVVAVLLDLTDGGDPFDSGTQPNEDFVFDEIALYSGPFDAVSNISEVDAGVINAFIGDEETYMLTHVIFHPVQKSLNRSLEVIYRLRIQMC